PGEPGENADNLPVLFKFKIADAVIQIKYFGRFNKNGLSGGGFVLDESPDLPFVFSLNGNDHPPTADRQIAIRHPTLLYRLTEYAVEPFAGLQFALMDLLKQFLQRRGSIRTDIALVVNHPVDRRKQFLFNNHLLKQLLLKRIPPLPFLYIPHLVGNVL